MDPNLSLQPQQQTGHNFPDAVAKTDNPTELSALEQARQTIALADISAASTPTVMEALQSSRAKERVDARIVTLEMLSTLDKAAAHRQKTVDLQQNVEEMIRRLTAETARAHRRAMMRRVKIAAFVVSIATLMWATHGRFAGNWWLFWWIGGGVWAADKTWGTRQHTVSALQQAGDPRAVGVLAMATHDAEKTVRRAAHQALLQLLPRVRADHADSITPPQMNALLELAFRSEPAMQIAVLQGLEQIGDQRAVPVVQNLSLSPNLQVRMQARQCLPYLTERARRAEQSATLLRGTANPAQVAAPRELLRPVGQTTEDPHADELLRPTEVYRRDNDVETPDV